MAVDKCSFGCVFFGNVDLGESSSRAASAMERMPRTGAERSVERESREYLFLGKTHVFCRNEYESAAGRSNADSFF